MNLLTGEKVLVVMPIQADPELEAKRKILIETLGERAALPDFTPYASSTDVCALSELEHFRKFSRAIVDLSFERPSCYFELGVAQALGVKCCLLAKTGTVIHQHFGDVTFYDDLEQFQNLVEGAVFGEATP